MTNNSTQNNELNQTFRSIWGEMGEKNKQNDERITLCYYVKEKRRKSWRVGLNESLA